MYHLKNAKESNGVGVFKKNNSENTSENTYTVNKVCFSLSLSLRKLSLDLMPGINQINENSANPKIP